MNQTNHPSTKLRAGKKVYSKKIIPILAIVLVIIGIILIVSLSNNKKEKNQTVYNPGNVQVEVKDNAGGNQITKPENSQNSNMANELGAATTGEMNGGSSDVQQGVSSTDKLLEGKEIEVK